MPAPDSWHRTPCNFLSGNHTRIFFCCSISPITLVPDVELLNSVKFMRDQCIFCANKVTLGELLDGFRMGVGHPKDQAMVRTSEPSTALAGRGGSLEAESTIGHAYVMKPPKKSHRHKL